jgi:hypothetical protein
MGELTFEPDNKMPIPTICVVGAGQLGSRHLQALAKLDIPSRITVIDPSDESLAMSKCRVQEINGHEKHSFIYQSAIGKLGGVDLAVIATSANVRRAVIEQLLEENVVRNLVLEKVLFQRARDCAEIGILLKDKRVLTWVNAPRRMWPFYQLLKKELAGETILTIRQSAGSWGMGCNAYHYLDIFSFLTGEELSSLSTDLLDRKLIDSKRAGFKEVSGTLCGKFKCGTVFFLSDFKDTLIAPTITIETIDRNFIIDEINQSIFSISGKSLSAELIPEPKYQSELTHLLAEEILTRGTCPLTPYDEASSLHQHMLNAFAVIFAPGEKREDALCPIT